MNDFWRGTVVGGAVGAIVGFLAKWLMDYARTEFERGGLVKLTAHRAYPEAQPPECYFVRVVNHAPDREIELKDVWFESSRPVPVLNPQRPLPATVKPGAMWETWIPVSEVPTKDPEEACRQVRVRLSTGQVIKSSGRTPDTDLSPGFGGIAGRAG